MPRFRRLRHYRDERIYRSKSHYRHAKLFDVETNDPRLTEKRHTVTTGIPSHPPSGVTPPGGEVAPRVAAVSRSGQAEVCRFPAGSTTALQKQVRMPLDFVDRDIPVDISYTVTAIPGALDVLTFFLGYHALKCDAAESTSYTPTYLQKDELGRTATPPFASEIPSPGEVGCFTLVIPNTAVEPGDILVLTIWRSRADSYAGTVLLLPDLVTVGEIAR